jgi:hypothetical protein
MRGVERYILIICAAVLLCGCYNSTRLPDDADLGLNPNMPIAELRDLWRGKTLTIDEEYIIGGRVTSSDVAGNFYQTFTITDGERAAEIMAGMRDLHNSYPLGCYVSVLLDGCAVGVERGVLQIGLIPASYSSYAVDYFYSRAVIDKYVVRRDDVAEVSARTLNFEGLDESLCGMLVRIEGVRYLPEVSEVSEVPETPETPKAPEIPETEPAIWSGYRAFVDAEGNRIYTYTSDYANFATEEVPTVTCDITGILQYGKVGGVSGECFILKMRSKDDCVAVDSATL